MLMTRHLEEHLSMSLRPASMHLHSTAQPTRPSRSFMKSSFLNRCASV
jgi:hypothetical protein